MDVVHFPRLKALSKSHMALYYGIQDLHEAKAYIEQMITSALLVLDESDPPAVMGYPDNLKLCSCMTLFMYATEDNRLFTEVIDKFFGGNTDPKTRAIITNGK